MHAHVPPASPNTNRGTPLQKRNLTPVSPNKLPGSNSNSPNKNHPHSNNLNRSPTKLPTPGHGHASSAGMSQHGSHGPHGGNSTLAALESQANALGSGLSGAGGLQNAGLSAKSAYSRTAIEHTVNSFVQQEDSLLEDMRQILMQTRKQYDEVHSEAVKKEAELARVREAIKLAELGGGLGGGVPGVGAVPGSPDGKKKGGDGKEAGVDGGKKTSPDKKGGSGGSSVAPGAGAAATFVEFSENMELEQRRKHAQDTYESTLGKINECKISRKVYDHMLDRSKRELTVLKQKVLQMESHLQKRTAEEQLVVQEGRKREQTREQLSKDFLQTERQLSYERELRSKALAKIQFSLQTKKNAIRRRTDFEKWRTEIAQEAANEAFNASAARLRKIWAMEKLAGNCLVKIMQEQISRSQATEDGFQRIREVTGLSDVLEIVNKFLNREVEHDQLKSEASEAEAKLASVREEFRQFKSQIDTITLKPGDVDGGPGGKNGEMTEMLALTDGSERNTSLSPNKAAVGSGSSGALALRSSPTDNNNNSMSIVPVSMGNNNSSPDGGGSPSSKNATTNRAFLAMGHSRAREIYQDVELHERRLTAGLKQHESARKQLEDSIVQRDHIRRWTKRMSKSLAFFDSYFSFEQDDLYEFFHRLNSVTIPQLLNEVRNQLSTGRLQRRHFAAAASKEFHESARLLNDKEFLRSNCRVVNASAGGPNTTAPASKDNKDNKDDDDSSDSEAGFGGPLRSGFNLSGFPSLSSENRSGPIRDVASLKEGMLIGAAYSGLTGLMGGSPGGNDESYFGFVGFGMGLMGADGVTLAADGSPVSRKGKGKGKKGKGGKEGTDPAAALAQMQASADGQSPDPNITEAQPSSLGLGMTAASVAGNIANAILSQNNDDGEDAEAMVQSREKMKAASLQRALDGQRRREAAAKNKRRPGH